MIYKHNKGRTWKYRALAMADGYRLRIHGFTVPVPLYTPLPSNVPSGAPDDDLIGAIAPDFRDDDDALGELVLA